MTQDDRKKVVEMIRNVVTPLVTTINQGFNDLKNEFKEENKLLRNEFKHYNELLRKEFALAMNEQRKEFKQAMSEQTQAILKVLESHEDKLEAQDKDIKDIKKRLDGQYETKHPNTTGQNGSYSRKARYLLQLWRTV